MNQHDTQRDGWRTGLPWHEALIVSGALCIGLLVTNYATGIPSGIGDWLSLAGGGILAPVIAYSALRRQWLLFAITLFGFLNGLYIATV